MPKKSKSGRVTSMSLDPNTLAKAKTIGEAYGISSRSAVVALAISELHARMVADGQITN